MSDQQYEREGEGERIPRLPRAPLLGKVSIPALVRIGMFATFLYAMLAMRSQCATGVGRFVVGFDDLAADGGRADTEPARYAGYELMTAEEALRRWPDRPQDDAGIAIDASSKTSDAKAETSRPKQRQAPKQRKHPE